MIRQAKLSSIVITVAVLSYAMIASLLYSISGTLHHDEHQFMASAFMVAEYGLHPYMDFAYFHMPNLVYIYAPFFYTPYPFILTRIFIGICGFGICLTIYLHARSLLSNHNKFVSLTIPICITLLLVHSSLYKYAASHVWNHIPSTLFALLAFLLHCRASCGQKQYVFYFLSGMSLGMAIGIRLSFAPLIVPFLFATIFFNAGTFKTRSLLLLIFGLGGLCANVIAIFFFFNSYQDFWFGNLGYPKLNTLYQEKMSYQKAMTLTGKLKYLISLFTKHETLLVSALASIYSFALFTIDKLRCKDYPRSPLFFILLSFPFLLLGCFAPTPSWSQYFFVLIPFLMLLILYALSSCQKTTLSKIAVLPLILLATASFAASPLFNPRSIINVLTNPQSLAPLKLQKESEEVKLSINSLAANGKVLTLSPLLAVNSKLPIYKEFVTGRFAWKVSILLSEEEARMRNFPFQSQIESYVKENPPVAIITGTEEKFLEMPLNEVAYTLGYQQTSTSTGLLLWLNTK